jgi:hypothetical protein
MAEHLKEEGKDAASQVVDTAKESAAQLKQEGQESASNVADTAKS